MKQLEATVIGRVQGVSFRYYTRQEARRLGVTGWVANQPDGSVKVVGQGTESALEGLLTFLRRGPSMARVDKIDISWVDSDKGYTQFNIRYI